MLGKVTSRGHGKKKWSKSVLAQPGPRKAWFRGRASAGLLLGQKVLTGCKFGIHQWKCWWGETSFVLWGWRRQSWKSAMRVQLGYQQDIIWVGFETKHELRANRRQWWTEVLFGIWGRCGKLCIQPIYSRLIYGKKWVPAGYVLTILAWVWVKVGMWYAGWYGQRIEFRKRQCMAILKLTTLCRPVSLGWSCCNYIKGWSLDPEFLE